MMFNRQLLFSLLPFVSGLPTSTENLQSRATSLEQYIDSENAISFTNAFKNIGEAVGAKPGIIAASPSTSDPDYLYTWTRDSALTTHGLLEVANDGAQTEQVLEFVNDYITAQDNLQQLSNPSGSFSDLSGLGEPKFEINETAFTGPWGRPQRDGPALRARALMKYVDLFNSTISSAQRTTITNLIQNDLDYVVKYWNAPTFDLWEEVQGNSFFTDLSSFHALAIGSQYFKSLNETRAATYFNESKSVRCYADTSYWGAGANENAYSSNINNNNNRSGLDANSIIAAQLYPTSPSASYSSDPCSTEFFSPCSDRMLASTYAVVESFRGVYPINSAREAKGSKALAIGRYTEDVYYDGNPWHLTTLAPAEQLHRANSIWNQFGEINVTSTSLPFFQSLLSNATVGTYKKGDGKFEQVVDAVSKYADGFISIVQEYTPSNGSLWEQFNKTTGESTSARDLTWSYVAFLTTTHARSLQSNATAPTGTPIYSAADLNCSATVTGVPVSFKVLKTTIYGENIYLAGSAPALGGWDLSKAIPLNANSYTSENPRWQTSAPVRLPADTSFEYKYVLKGIDGKYTYENGNNRQYTTPESGSPTLSDTWQN
ncbi:uncharacterized protein JCM6883_007478 [Sporobolomyces salmoneus]|uniref:uncharacterized protein n=1 Tax=Sporobolomyces salmoneus TaxID=183962 RepID=UPI00317A7EDF